MKEVVIKFEPFTIYQTVFIRDLEGDIFQDDIPQSELPKYLSCLKDVDKIHFFGNIDFIKKIAEECITKFDLTTEILFNK